MSAGPYALTRATPATWAQNALAILLVATPILWMALSSFKTSTPQCALYRACKSSFLRWFIRLLFQAFTSFMAM